jgi:hypothetical protein
MQGRWTMPENRVAPVWVAFFANQLSTGDLAHFGEAKREVSAGHP